MCMPGQLFDRQKFVQMSSLSCPYSSERGLTVCGSIYWYGPACIYSPCTCSAWMLTCRVCHRPTHMQERWNTKKGTPLVTAVHHSILDCHFADDLLSPSTPSPPPSTPPFAFLMLNDRFSWSNSSCCMAEISQTCKGVNRTFQLWTE